MSQTITRDDIHIHVTQASCGGEFDEQQLQAITDAVLEAAPLRSWRLENLQYVSEELDTEAFWGLVESVTTTGQGA